jgi:hypothetical protein
MVKDVLEARPAGVGALQIDRWYAKPGREGRANWYATGRIIGERRRLIRFTRVQLEITALSEYASELRIRPTRSRVQTWTKRRQREYFDRAHDAADGLVRSLSATARRDRAASSLRNLADQITPEPANWQPLVPMFDGSWIIPT